MLHSDLASERRSIACLLPQAPVIQKHLSNISSAHSVHSGTYMDVGWQGAREWGWDLPLCTRFPTLALPARYVAFRDSLLLNMLAWGNFSSQMFNSLIVTSLQHLRSLKIQSSLSAPSVQFHSHQHLHAPATVNITVFQWHTPACPFCLWWGNNQDVSQTCLLRQNRKWKLSVFKTYTSSMFSPKIHN